jgi:hypothetical protein
LNSSSKERPKESIKEEQLQKNKKTMFATVIGVECLMHYLATAIIVAKSFSFILLAKSWLIDK